MNREILFRGKRKSQDKDFDGEWVYGDLLHNLVYDGRESEVRIGDVYFDKDKNDEIHGTGCVLVYPETVGQFTGLTDKNGNKIFEGDIVRDEFGDITVVEYGEQVHEEEYGDELIYCGLNLKIGSGYPKAAKRTFEIIGNVHDNPELLTDKT